MVISNIKFQRKNIHNKTRLSPEGRFSSQIDHVLIENKFKTIKNVKSYRADADTDHYLVVTNFKVKMSTEWKKKKNNQKI